MNESILEYLFDLDKYLLLWVVARKQRDIKIAKTNKRRSKKAPAAAEHSPQTAPVAVQRSDLHPDLLQIINDPTDVPDVISVLPKWTNSIRFDNEYRLHTNSTEPAVHASSINLFWGQIFNTKTLSVDSPITSGASVIGDKSYSIARHRDKAPAHISLQNVQMHLQHGILHRGQMKPAIIVGLASFFWFSHGLMTRNNGPHSVELKNLCLYFENGSFDLPELGDGSVPAQSTRRAINQLNMEWQRGSWRIGDEKIRQIIREQSLEANPLATNCFFPDAQDEMVFLSELDKLNPYHQP